MPQLSKTTLIRHDADQLFELVADIRRYPDFIKWIRSLKVRDEAGDFGTQYSCIGEASVGFKGFNETFATRVNARREDRSIAVRLANGPFKHLENDWRFVPVSEGSTEVQFRIDYAFKNPILALLARANTGLAVDKIMTAFREEADRRYGRPSVRESAS